MSSETTAMIMPTDESLLPFRAVTGEFIKCRPRTKKAAPTRNAICTRCWRLLASTTATSSARRLVGLGGRASPEHLEHPIGDPVATHDVRAGENDGHESQRAGEWVVRGRSERDRTDEHDSVDRVRARHQWRMQRRGDSADHLEPKQDRQHEERHVVDQVADVHAGASPLASGVRSFLVASWTTWPP